MVHCTNLTILFFSDNACSKKELHTPEENQEKNDESSEHASSSSCSKSSKSGGNDFSSDEAKESEGDSDPVVEHTDKKQDVAEVGNTVNATSGNTEGPEQSQVIENNKPNTVIVKFSCDICNISVNSSTQLSQVSTNIASMLPTVTNYYTCLSSFQHMNSPKHHVKAAEGQKSTEKLKEIPMLNMFLKTLQPPSNYFPNQEKEGEESSSNTEVER